MQVTEVRKIADTRSQRALLGRALRINERLLHRNQSAVCTHAQINPIDVSKSIMQSDASSYFHAPSVKERGYSRNTMWKTRLVQSSIKVAIAPLTHGSESCILMKTFKRN
jgi:hypothetical protein